MRSKTWVGSLFASCINRKCSHFTRRLEFSLLTILNKIQKKIFWRIRVSNKNTNYSYIKLWTSCNLTSNILILLSISFIQFDKTFSKNCFFRLDSIESNQIKKFPLQHMQVPLFLILLIICFFKTWLYDYLCMIVLG